MTFQIVPEFDVQPERGRGDVATGRFLWSVIDPVTSGVLEDGIEHSKMLANLVGAARCEYWHNLYNQEEVSIDE